VKFVFKPVNEVPPHDAEVLKILLNADPLDIDPNYEPRKGTPAARSVLGELYLPLDGLVDVSAEKTRLEKELARIKAEIAKAEQRLNNPAFTAKAPPNVLEEHRKRLEDWQAKKRQSESALQTLG